jgi:hypothetical protein
MSEVSKRDGLEPLSLYNPKLVIVSTHSALV